MCFLSHKIYHQIHQILEILGNVDHVAVFGTANELILYPMYQEKTLKLVIFSSTKSYIFHKVQAFSIHFIGFHFKKLSIHKLINFFSLVYSPFKFLNALP